jgi:plastocyanin
MTHFHGAGRILAVVAVLALSATAGCGGGGSPSTALPQSNANANANANTNAGKKPQGAQNWAVDAGASHRDGALQALTFASSTIVIDEGDSVTWTSASLHTVSFLAPGQNPLTTLPPNNPVGGNVVDGTTFVSSAILLAGQKYTLTFPKAGTYTYFCLLHPPEMTGQVIVQPAGTPYPHTQGFYSGQGNKEENNFLAAAQQAIQLFPFQRDGTTVAAGISPGLASLPPSNSTVWRFLNDKTLDDTITIPVNTTVTWVNETNNEPHTVTLPIAGQPLTVGDPFTPPMGIVVNGVNIYDGTQLTNSGPFGSAVGLPTNSYSLKFTARGTFKYFCLFHDDFGMEGTVIVK